MSEPASTARAMPAATDAFSLMGASLIFAARFWPTPTLLASPLGGTPSLHGSDIISPIGTVVAGATVLASGVGAAWRGTMSVTQAAGLGAGAAASGGSRENVSGIPVTGSNASPAPQPQPAPRISVE